MKMDKLKVFIGYIAFIVFAEVVTSFVDPGYGLFLHSLILVSLLVLSSLKYGENPSKLYLSLSLAPLIRIVSLSVPLTGFPRYSWYIVVNVPVLVATLALMRVQGMGFKDAGVRFNMPLEQSVIALTGISIGFIDYYLLRPEPLALGMSYGNLALLAVALGLSTGLVEELVFRGIMQPHAIEMFGEKIGLIGVAAVFAALHIGWLSIPDIVFVFMVGLFYGFMALKTGSIIGVSVSHGITNIILFMLAPLTKLI